MFNKKIKAELKQNQALLKKSNAIINSIKNSEFSPDSIIIDAKDLFLKITGYQKAEVTGKHHSVMYIDSYSNSVEYKEFWQNLRNGSANKGTFERKNKHGDIIWLEATYFPTIESGKVIKVMKITSDVTAETINAISQKSIIDALNRSQAIIEFTPDREIITANCNFTDAENKVYHLKVITMPNI